MPYAPSEEYKIADSVNSILDELIIPGLEHENNAIVTLSAILNESDASNPQQHQDAQKRLEELLSQGFETHVHTTENSVLSRTYNHGEEKKLVYIASDPSISEEEQIAEARREYKAIILREIQNRLATLITKKIEPSEIARFLREAGDDLDSRQGIIQIAFRLRHIGDNLVLRRFEEIHDRDSQIENLCRVTLSFRRVIGSYASRVEFMGFQETPLAAFGVILSGMAIIARAILSAYGANIDEHDDADDLHRQLASPRQ